jgi:hypothetical protein
MRRKKKQCGQWTICGPLAQNAPMMNAFLLNKNQWHIYICTFKKALKMYNVSYDKLSGAGGARQPWFELYLI